MRRSSSAHLRVIALEQLEEARLGPGGALAAAQPEGLQPVHQLLDVEREVLHPQRGPLADGGELGRLEVGIGQAGPRRVGPREPLQLRQHVEQAAEEQLEAGA